MAPFAVARRSVVVAAGYAIAALAWALTGDALPGGRWLALHLFTLGTLTNAVSALSLHFGQTLLHARPDRQRELPRLAMRNVAVLGVLLGVATGWTPAVAAGSTVLAADVFITWWLLRRARKHSLPGRFGFVVRTYERACGAFLHGALLGALLGTGVLRGRWYSAGRMAHLHVMLLGWAGLPILATVVFFVPTLARARIMPGADVASARALRLAPTALTVATLSLLLTGVGGNAGTGLRLLAGAAVLVFAGAAAVVGVWAWRAGTGAAPPGSATLIRYACLALPAACSAQATLLMLDETAAMVAVGAFYLTSVLAASLLGSAPYFLVMSSPAEAPERRRVLERVARGGRHRLMLLVAASTLLTLTHAVRDSGGWTAGAQRLAWAALLVTAAWTLGSVHIGWPKLAKRPRVM